MISGNVTNTTATGLDGVHIDRRQLLQNIGNISDFGPVKLHVLASAEVAVTAVVHARYVGERAQLITRQGAIRNCDTEHWR